MSELDYTQWSEAWEALRNAYNAPRWNKSDDDAHDIARKAIIDAASGPAWEAFYNESNRASKQAGNAAVEYMDKRDDDACDEAYSDAYHTNRDAALEQFWNKLKRFAWNKKIGAENEPLPIVLCDLCERPAVGRSYSMENQVAGTLVCEVHQS